MAEWVLKKRRDGEVVDSIVVEVEIVTAVRFNVDVGFMVDDPGLGWDCQCGDESDGGDARPFHGFHFSSVPSGGLSRQVEGTRGSGAPSLNGALKSRTMRVVCLFHRKVLIPH
jgi:hypothetical protein